MNQRKLPRAVLTILTVLPLWLAAVGAVAQQQQQQQKFRVKPLDLLVAEGSEALLRCEIQNTAGAVQWTKDGEVLGYEEATQSITGYPRYSMLRNGGSGIYNLRIANVTLEDDDEYECQVHPYMHHKPIRAKAKLTVIVPPASIDIQGHGQHAKVDVREGQDLVLTCVVPSAKPAAQIVWYRANVEYKPDTIETKTAEVTGGRYTVTSKLRLKPTSDDDYVDYTCQARHQAIPEDRPLQSTVQLSVQYPPGAPYIEGYTPGEPVRSGQRVELVCRSRGGNPPAQLIWYKNDNQVRMAYRTADRMSENIYSFVAEANDNKARLRCEANNNMATRILKTELTLSVLFPPAHVIVSGSSEARVGESVALQCQTAPSNPKADIKWVVNGQQVNNATAKVVPSPEGGWVTTSNITATVEASKRSMVAICHGLNMKLTENVQATHTVNVLLPPGPPIISGYIEGSIIPAGTKQKLMCVSSGGNPLATLTWYKNDKKIQSVSRTTDQSVSAELSILANVTDNQARYRCEAHNSATEIPLFETKVLAVHFAPDTAKVRVEPSELRPGTEATLVCDSSSSNPPARISWWHQGLPQEGSNGTSKPGLWSGTVSSLELKLNITQDMNGHVYTCQSTNEALQRSINVAVNLQVLYAPKFSPPTTTSVSGVEGEPLTVALLATGNPMSIAYTWTKDGQPITESGVPRIVSEGPILNVTRLKRTDAGVYTCEAVNSQGSAMINITVQVKYAATIQSVSENVIVNPGENATLNCTVDGNPLTPEHIRWERTGYDLAGKTSTTYANDTASLLVRDAHRDDVGYFRCIADNRVASKPATRDVLLIVNFAPEIDKSPTMLRAAAGAGERAELPCRAQAAPGPVFRWFRAGAELRVNQTAKYQVAQRQLDPLTHESVLLIEHTSSSDYGEYECRADNDLGTGSAIGRLDIKSPPESPATLAVLNVTHNSATLGWTPGFDGGHRATYRVRYREASSDRYRYEDAAPNEHHLTLTGLRSDTLYLFSVMAANVLGSSKYLPDLTRAQTRGSEVTVPPELSEKAELPSFVMFCIALAGLCLLIVNAGLVVWFVMKKRSKGSSNPGSKSATFEMYAPSSYNDTVTGETLSSVSEKSDAYSNDGSQPDCMDETRQKAASTYLVDGNDLPPPRYQQDGSLPHYVSDGGSGSGNSYITTPSPGPPMDGSYYNMNSGRYLSYPPMEPESASETLRRIARTMVPPPDVTHHTLPHRSHDGSLSAGVPLASLSGNIANAVQSTPKQPQGILKDPKRSNSNVSGTLAISALSAHPTQYQHQAAMAPYDPYAGSSGPSGLLTMAPHVNSSLGNGSQLAQQGMLMGTYDPPGSSSLASYNVSLGYTDADGHLV
ncbi:nephrin-like [Anopheles cruzii]|uniref:nephrin-like n=1 Tax=Anopheles cruzii TaxID=68878 RepID=UPI0022EC52D8|nr:nephrin-like [Anopheles cruzii]